MITKSIAAYHPNQKQDSFNDDIFIADYSKQTSCKRSVEFSIKTTFTDIDYFSLLNPNKLLSTIIVFDNKSFNYTDGSPKSQCESVCFPSDSDNDSWILFLELKYGNEKNNNNNLKKAIRQLYRTRYHYIQSGAVKSGTNNKFYLIASLPCQAEPFNSFTLTQSQLTNLLLKHRIILRFKNCVSIYNDKIINI